MTEKYPRISVVTPSLNQGRFIREAIESVLSQDYPTVEHIVIDGGSTDGTLGVLQEYRHLRWISEPDEGQSDALNKGFRIAEGELIGWLNADDRYLPGCFHAIANAFRENPNVDILYGDYRWIDLNGKVLQHRHELDFDLFLLKYLPFLYIPTASSFLHRRVFQAGNFLRTDYHYAMDYEFYLRLALQGFRFSHISRFVADFRWHDAGKSTAFVGKQKAEHVNAQISLITDLDRLHPKLKKTTLRFLTIPARAKRFTLKALHGYYFSQWTRKTD